MDDVLVDRRAATRRGPRRSSPPRRPARPICCQVAGDRARVAGQDRRRRGGRCRRRARARSSRRRRGSRRRAGRARSPAARSAGSRRGSRGPAMRGPRSSRSASRRSGEHDLDRDPRLARTRSSGGRPAGTAAPSAGRASAAEPRAPVAASRSGGSTSRTWRSPDGAPLRSTRRGGRPVSVVGELAPGSPIVAEQHTITGLAAVVGAHPEQPPEDVGDVAAEHAAVRVQLVDDDDPELLEQLEPLRVVGEDRRVEHVRVGDDDLAGARGSPTGSAPACRRRRSRPRSSARPPPTSSRELGDLVLAERLGREQEQRPGGRVLGDAPGGPAARSTASCPTPSA